MLLCWCFTTVVAHAVSGAAKSSASDAAAVAISSAVLSVYTVTCPLQVRTLFYAP
jgi:hypothetical protein